MNPPKQLNVLDSQGGFTAITKRGTLWRPGSLLKQTVRGELQTYDEQSFFQTNNNVTQGIYKVPGYRYRVAVWFDNVTGARIA